MLPLRIVCVTVLPTLLLASYALRRSKPGRFRLTGPAADGWALSQCSRLVT
jgi:hypothetical protein